ncbi:DnaD domain protein, partial [Clostridium sp. CM028]
SSKVIIMAIDEAVEYNAKTIKYITKVLNSWISKGIKTSEQVIFYQKQWASKKSGSSSPNVKNGGFCDYDQRTYDFDLLEKQLLGQVY